MYRDDVDPVRGLLVEVVQDHPRPGPEDEAGGRPAPSERWPGQWEGLEDLQGSGHPRPGIAGKSEVGDRLADIPLCARGDENLGQDQTRSLRAVPSPRPA